MILWFWVFLCKWKMSSFIGTYYCFNNSGPMNLFLVFPYTQEYPKVTAGQKLQNKFNEQFDKKPELFSLEQNIWIPLLSSGKEVNISTSLQEQYNQHNAYSPHLTKWLDSIWVLHKTGKIMLLNPLQEENIRACGLDSMPMS